MATLYTHKDSNIRKTWFLMTSFFLVVMGLGWFFSWYMGDQIILVLAVALAIGMNVFAYWNSAKLVVWTSGAKPADEKQFRELHNIVENLAITAGLPTPKIAIIPDSAINAFATGRDPQHATIAVTSGAIEQLTNEELEGVIAHELSHVKNYDIRVMMVVIVLVGTIALLADWLLRARWYAGSRGERSDRQGAAGILLALGIVLAIVAPIAAQLIKFAVARRREYLADASGALLTRYPEGLARALEKIAAANQPILHPNTATAHLYLANPFGGRRQWFTNLLSTHPPIDDRIRILRSMAV